ncbi:MAG TPA: hypothetical protein PLC80_12645 [Draconibacterium sp.]|nr:hypothetical protein [Draconibacterium sp.]
MHRIEYRYKRKGKLNIVWLQKSNKYINLKNPAFDIFQLLAKNTDKELIYRFLTNKYGFSPDSCKTLVSNLEFEIAKINIPNEEEIELPFNSECSDYYFEPFSAYSYKYGESAFSISYENKFLENWLHPIISHLYSDKKEDVAFQLEIFNCDGKIVFREKSAENSVIYPAGKIFQQLAGKLFGKSDNDWLLKAHASAITNHKKTILISGSSGSGKTTLAALLLQKGFDLVSDDLVLIDNKIRAFGFPSAMSVKKGSVEKLMSVFPELATKPEIQLSPEKKVRYLNVGAGKNKSDEVFPVNTVVFVKYNSGSDFKLTKLSTSKGIRAFLEQAYITPNPDCAEIFLSWAVSASFYYLTYSDSDTAIDALLKILENDL